MQAGSLIGASSAEVLGGFAPRVHPGLVPAAVTDPTASSTPPRRPVSGHRGFVAGRHRNGALSDDRTDVTRCAERTFISYVPACSCGWVGMDRAVSAEGYRACQRLWVTGHLASLPVGAAWLPTAQQAKLVEDSTR